MPRTNMPTDWEPPAPAWESVWSDRREPFVCALFGTSEAGRADLEEWAEVAFRNEHGPMGYERGQFYNRSDQIEYLFLAYWRQAAYSNWVQSSVVTDWWQSPAREQAGYAIWREAFQMPFDHLETLHSTQDPHGVGVYAEDVYGPILEHGYEGSMRDRIPISATTDLRANESCTDISFKQSGQRISLQPPRNMCVIRSGQNWGLCGDEERKYYLQNVRPVLEQGMRYLRDAGEDARCYCMRLVRLLDAQWQPTDQSFGLGYGADIYTFEEWAASHSTHLAIFDEFMKMVAHFGEAMQLRLWHEVTVLPASAGHFEYINCSDGTGLLSSS